MRSDISFEGANLLVLCYGHQRIVSYPEQCLTSEFDWAVPLKSVQRRQVTSNGWKSFLKYKGMKA